MKVLRVPLKLKFYYLLSLFVQNKKTPGFNEDFPKDIRKGEEFSLDKLKAYLKINNIKVHLETSGAYDLTGSYDWICLSPKKRKLPKKEIYKKANELKIIAYNKSDFKFALQEEKKVNDNCKLFIQPEWSKFDEIKKDIVKFVKENPKWSVSLQTHKYLEID